ncbi:hypothetical protein BH11PLA1_BH11PLA1_10090 [soil metagenome]
MSFARFWAVPAAVVLVSTMGAYAQVDADAKAMLDKSAKAIADLKSVSFKVTTQQPGQRGAAPTPNAMTIKMLAGKDVPLKTLYTGEHFFILEGAARPVTVLIENLQPITTGPGARRRITWIDHQAKKVITEETGAGSKADIWIGTLEKAYPGPFEPTGKNPFESEGRAQKVELLESKAYDGVPCQIIKATLDDKKERTLAIGASDMLPRYYEAKAMGATRAWTFTEVNADAKLTDKDFEIAVPKGYEVEKREVKATPIPQVPTTPVDAGKGMQPPPMPVNDKNTTGAPAQDMPTPKPQSLMNMPGGLKPGAAVPAWELAAMEGAPVTSESVKGNTVVLGFWGPKFDASTALANTLNEVAKAHAPNVKVFGVACRMEDATDRDVVTNMWKTNAFAYPGLMNGDDLANRLNIRGFPSVVVISADGKAQRFIEGASTVQEVTEAIAAAQ